MCNATLQYRKDKERARSEAAHSANVRTKVNAQTSQGKCATAQAKALATISAWLEQQGSSSSTEGHYKASCSTEDRQQLESQTGDTSAQKSATFGLVKGYSTDSKSTVALLADQVDARASYDVDYLANKTGAGALTELELQQLGLNLSLSIDGRFKGLNLSDVRACATLLGGDCPSGAGALALAQSARDNIVNQYQYAQGQYGNTAEQLANYADEVTQRLAEVQSAFSSITNTLNGDFPELGGFDGIVGISLPSTSLSPGVLPDLTLPDVDIPVSDTFEAIAASVSDTVSQYEQNLGDAISNANLDTSGFNANLDGISIGGFEDYDPPTVDALAVKQKHEQESDDFEQDAAVGANAWGFTPSDCGYVAVATWQ